MELERVGDVRILRISTPEEAARWRPEFIGAYQTVFGGAPYHERFYPSEAEGIYRSYTRSPDNICLLAERKGRVVGFGVAIPLSAKASVYRELTGLITRERTMYLADLGVLEPWRQRGIGGALIRQRIRLIDPSRYDDVVLRVSATRNISYEHYLKLGFEEMGAYMEVAALRTDGQVTTDRRLFLYQALPRLREQALSRDEG